MCVCVFFQKKKDTLPLAKLIATENGFLAAQQQQQQQQQNVATQSNLQKLHGMTHNNNSNNNTNASDNIILVTHQGTQDILNNNTASLSNVNVAKIEVLSPSVNNHPSIFATASHPETLHTHTTHSNKSKNKNKNKKNNNNNNNNHSNNNNKRQNQKKNQTKENENIINDKQNHLQIPVNSGGGGGIILSNPSQQQQQQQSLLLGSPNAIGLHSHVSSMNSLQYPGANLQPMPLPYHMTPADQSSYS